MRNQFTAFSLGLKEIKNFALEHNKTFMALCFERLVAWEIRRVHHIFFEDIREFVEKKK
ncbi:hypothetical protein L6258_00170 [Candidatus Parcubacteria bacterium]|nr:hypothetical protein [Candidatus Parcubacteria bacterium]